MILSSLLEGVKTQDVYEEGEVERVTDKDNENLKNSLFVCINGNQCDGHSLAENALKNGATAIPVGKFYAFIQKVRVTENFTLCFIIITCENTTHLTIQLFCIFYIPISGYK